MIVSTPAPVSYVYCPSPQLIKKLCESNQPYGQELEPFPQCLILQLNKVVQTPDNLKWRLKSINPPNLASNLHFIIANVDQNGTHCVYQTDNPSHVVIFTLENQQRLIPSFSPLDKAGINMYWRTDIQSRYHVDLYNGVNRQGNILMCKPMQLESPAKGQVAYPLPEYCPFVSPQMPSPSKPLPDKKMAPST